MHLKEYLFRKNIKIGDFAKQVGISGKTLWGIMRGHDTKLSIGVKIEEVTHGQVTCRDLLKEKECEPMEDNGDA